MYLEEGEYLKIGQGVSEVVKVEVSTGKDLSLFPVARSQMEMF
jgi:hypothetical protein